MKCSQGKKCDRENIKIFMRSAGSKKKTSPNGLDVFQICDTEIMYIIVFLKVCGPHIFLELASFIIDLFCLGRLSVKNFVIIL